MCRAFSRVYQVLWMGFNAISFPFRQILKHVNHRTCSEAETKWSRLHCLRQCRSLSHRKQGTWPSSSSDPRCPFSWILPLFPLMYARTCNPTLMQADTFPNWKADPYIPDTPIYLSLEQLSEVVVAEELGQRKVEDKKDLIFKVREHYQTLTPIPRCWENHWVYWPKVNLQHQDISYDNNFTSHLHTCTYLSTLHKYPY